MSNVSTVSADEVVAAVQNDPAIDEASFNQLKGMVGQLAQIIGDKHDTLVTFAPLCEVTLTLWKRLKEAGCTYDASGKLDELMQPLMMFDGHFGELLYVSGVTEAEAMVSPEMGLNADMRQLYLDGKLTFGTLARCQPSVFLT
jgi:hypothetical protein